MHAYPNSKKRVRTCMYEYLGWGIRAGRRSLPLPVRVRLWHLPMPAIFGIDNTHTNSREPGSRLVVREVRKNAVIHACPLLLQARGIYGVALRHEHGEENALPGDPSILPQRRCCRCAGAGARLEPELRCLANYIVNATRFDAHAKQRGDGLVDRRPLSLPCQIVALRPRRPSQLPVQKLGRGLQRERGGRRR